MGWVCLKATIEAKDFWAVELIKEASFQCQVANCLSWDNGDNGDGLLG